MPTSASKSKDAGGVRPVEGETFECRRLCAACKGDVVSATGSESVEDA